MTVIRSQVTNYGFGAVPADYIVNDVYHTVDEGIVFGDADYDNHATQVRDCFSGHAAGYPDFVLLQGRIIEVKCYDMADAEPRPVRAHKTYNSSPNTDTSDAPHQIALVLSYYPGRNIMGQRGRIYVGPWPNGLVANRPTTGQMDQLLSLGHSLFDVGGENVAHVLRHTGLQTSAKGVSPATYGVTKSGHAPGSTQPITNYWVDNSWDVIRARQPKATARRVLAP